MNQQPKYKFYATLLDAFQGYLHSDVIYQRYWGFSENPPHTEEEFEQKQFEDLINRINRAPFDSEAADRGTAFNEVIDCMIDHVKSEKVPVEKMYSDDVVVGLRATYNKRIFDFPIALCREFADYYKGALTQQFTEATLSTQYGDVLLYGYIDELMPTSVHDIKTTSKYSAFKFKDHWQHIVYPYCLNQNGNDIKLFEYNIAEIRVLVRGMVWTTFTESYSFVADRDIPLLTNHCEKLIEFIEMNKELITDKKIFGLI